MTRCDVAKIFTMVLLLVLTGCSTNTDLGGSSVPNSRPDTRVTGQPPTLLEAGFAVEFNWTASDPDSRIVGFQWKISDNGLDGISPRDTLTVDPLTGAEINPWRYTTMTDSVFIVLADVEGFPGDAEGFERSFRTHSFFIRAVDDKGAVDPTPAQISFTSTTIVPTCSAVFPDLPTIITGVFSVPSTVNFSYVGIDDDFESGVPTHVRFLWTDGEYWDGDSWENIISKRLYDIHSDLLIDFDDPTWSLWQEYGTTEEDRNVSYPDNLINDKHHLFAVQVRDTAGALSIGKTYGTEVLNVRIAVDAFSPEIEVNEYFLGEYTGDQDFNIPSGQQLNFSWASNATAYNGNIVEMRHGWDLIDDTDENDPGWAVPPGMAEQNRYATEKSFSQGVHTFTVRAKDDSGVTRTSKWTISIIPFVSRANQYNLAFVDQIEDHQSGRWPNSSNSIYYDDEVWRNEYWEFLAGAGGVTGFTLASNSFDHTETFNYEDLVQYKAVIISARSHSSQLVFQKFRPEGGLDKFVWLTPYQEFGGNVFLVGSQSMESFLEVQDYMVPIVFESTLQFYSLNDNNYIVGFGRKELRDGTFVPRGPLMYPFATVGISALDWNVPLGKNVYGRRFPASEDRSTKCSGLKEVRLLEEFRTNHFVAPSAIAEVIGTNPLIDWRDPMADAGLDTMLNLEFPFTGEEFVDEKIAERPAAVVFQDCEGGYNGKCIEPMFTGVTRMDWMREKIWELDPDHAWPGNTYENSELKDICGDIALTTYNPGGDEPSVPLGTARANGKTYGYLSYKTIGDKPGGKADVYWGFDPYRFDTDETRKAILWVMEHQFGLPLGSGSPGDK